MSKRISNERALAALDHIVAPETRAEAVCRALWEVVWSDKAVQRRAEAPKDSDYVLLLDTARACLNTPAPAATTDTAAQDAETLARVRQVVRNTLHSAECGPDLNEAWDCVCALGDLQAALDHHQKGADGVATAPGSGSQASGTETAAQALRDAAERLERKARWKYKAGERLWKYSDYGRLDPRFYDEIDKKPGEAGLRLCGMSGQMQRDADWLRARADRLDPGTRTSHHDGSNR